MNSLSRHHEEIESYVIDKLKKAGYEIIKFVYHVVNNVDVREQLKNCVTAECMFIRTLPDLLVTKINKSMFLEIKARSPVYSNLALELFPLMVNYFLEVKLKLNVIYVYGYKESNDIKLYYLPAKDIVKLVNRVILTDKFNESINDDIFIKFSLNVLNIKPEIRDKKLIKQRKSLSENVGSGDPFAVIPEDKLKRFRNFEELIRGEVE